MEISIQHTNAVCNGQNGTATATVTGGTIPYKAAWRKSGVAEASTDLLIYPRAGTYITTVTDANNCTVTAPSFTVTQPSGLILFSILIALYLHNKQLSTFNSKLKSPHAVLMVPLMLL